MEIRLDKEGHEVWQGANDWPGGWGFGDFSKVEEKHQHVIPETKS